jgi:hypothetical protein
MNPPAGFNALTSGLHQDALMFAEGDLGKLVENCMRFVPAELRAELKVYLTKVLETKAPADLKGILNREKRAIAFNSKAAREFFSIALEKLSSNTSPRASRSIHT